MIADETACDCGGTLVFDATIEGDTVGGIRRAGWLRCDQCGEITISRRGASADAWKLTSSGRSVDADGCRLRADGGDPGPVMVRVARVPALEAALRRIARGEAEPAEIARLALEVTP